MVGEVGGGGMMVGTVAALLVSLGGRIEREGRLVAVCEGKGVWLGKGKVGWKGRVCCLGGQY